MKLVTLTDNLERRFGLKKAIQLINEYGFDGYDCSLFGLMNEGKIFGGEDYIEKAKEIRDFADSIGIPCLQTHTPMPDMYCYSDIIGSFDIQRKALEISSVLGSSIAVIHPSSITDMEGNFEMLYSRLLPIAEKLGVRIATENMFSWKDVPEADTVPSACGTSRDFVRYIDYADSDYFTACLDLGHASMMNCEGAPKMIKALGRKRLGALHVHDNDCLHDDHIFPFTGKMDWDAICKALAEIDYSGEFTFEADAFMKKFPDELIPELLTLLHETGRYLIKKIESYK